MQSIQHLAAGFTVLEARGFVLGGGEFARAMSAPALLRLRHGDLVGEEVNSLFPASRSGNKVPTSELYVYAPRIL